MPVFRSSFEPALCAVDAAQRALAFGREPRALSEPVTPTSDDFADQFVVFQLNDAKDGPALLEASGVAPRLAGDSTSPDVLVGLELLAFHLGEGETVAPDTRATLRLTLGRDESSTDARLDTLFWTIAAGLRLYDARTGSRPQAKDLRADLRRAFGGRPVEVAGGVARLAFEVVKHPEPAWWRRTFSFAAGDTGKTLVSTLGFPALTGPALELVDGLLERLAESSPAPLFRSLPLRLALTRSARDDLACGGRVRVGCLNPGYAILARARDYATLLAADPIYHATYGRLLPSASASTPAPLSSTDDPFRALTYAVLRIGMRETSLEPTFRYL